MRDLSLTFEEFYDLLEGLEDMGKINEESRRAIAEFAAPGVDARIPFAPARSTVNQASDNDLTRAPGAPTGFVWGKSSLAELQGVKKELVDCATLALTRFSKVDFRCYDGLRTIEEQRRHFKNGTTRTMRSKHLEGLAVDLVPVIGGVLKWAWDGCFEIAWAMDQAATHMGIAGNIRWGGAWDRVLADYGNDRYAYKKEVQAYQNRHPGPYFIDGPHFEWIP